MDKEKKIAIILPSLELHGGCIVANHYAQLLIERGWFVAVIGTNDSKEIPCFWDKNIDIKQLSYAVNKKVSIVSFFLLESISIFREMKKRNILKTLHIYTPLAFCFSVLSAIGLCEKPILVVHDNPGMVGIGYVSFKILLPLIRFFIGEKNIFWVNKDLAQHASFFRKEGQYCEIFNGLEKSFIERPISISLIKAKKNKQLVYVGSPTKSKGWDLLINIAKYLYFFDPSINIICFLSRKPHQDMMGMPSNIKTMPFGSCHNDIALVMSESLIQIVCSRSESFCLPILEGMSQGCGIITTRTIGSERLAREFGGCKFFKDAKEIEALIKYFSNDISKHPNEYYNRVCRVRQLNWSRIGNIFDQALADQS